MPKLRKAAPKKRAQANVVPAAPADPNCPAGCELGPAQGLARAQEALDIRRNAAQEQYDRNTAFAAPSHPCNGDELLYSGANFIGNFSKGLPHDSATGAVLPDAYCALLRALNSGVGANFDAVPLGCTLPDCSHCPDCPPPPPKPGITAPQRQLEDPRAAYCYDLQGADSHSLVMPIPPAFGSRDEVSDILENYWMAVARDIPFLEYPNPNAAGAPVLDAALADLQRSGFYTAANPFVGFDVDRQGLFRGFSAGDQAGPYVSQFLLMDVPYGAQEIPARIATVLPGVDYLTSWDEWLGVQNGCDANQGACDPVRRFIRSGRDLGQYVHVDRDINAFWNAAWILLSGGAPLRRCEAAGGLGVEFAEGLPYVNPSAPRAEQFSTKAPKELGVGTFGPQHVLSALLEVEVRCLRAVWYQKWLVHRRLRPEEFGGRLHAAITGAAPFPVDGSWGQSPIFTDNTFEPANGQFGIFRYNALQNCNKRRSGPSDGSYLLPVAFAEGSPLHPSYGAGHATVAGACATVLKAFFVEEQCFLNPAQSNREGTSLVAYTRPDRNQITVRGEIDKLASNISLGRNFAGVHWRSDHTQSLLLGERIAIALLFDQRKLFREDFEFQSLVFMARSSSSTTTAP